MKQNRKDWTEAVRRSLEGAEARLPEGGWERLERELGDVMPIAPVVPSHRGTWIKYTAAAAAVLVCVSIGFRVFRSDRNVLERVVMVSDAAVSAHAAGTGEATPEPAVHTAVLTKPALPRASRTDFLPVQPETVVSVRGQGTPVARPFSGVPEDQDVSVRPVAGVPEDERDVALLIAGVPEDERDVALLIAGVPEDQGVSVRPVAGVPEDERNVALLSAGVPEEGAMPVPSEPSAFAVAPEPERAAVAAASVPEQRYNTSDYDGLFADARPVSRRGGGSVALSAGGIVTSANGAGGGGSSLLLASDGAASLRNAYQEYSYDHKQPLSFGVAFRKELGRGFSAETGLVYTLLRSSVSIPGGSRDVHQRLHLLGIPLRVNWEFLRAGGFSLYVGAGGMAQKSVSARFAGEKISEKKVQWSVFGALGAQYRLGKTVGIYFEPEVSHYFTETTLRTPYTDSSVALNLQLGVRFNY